MNNENTKEKALLVVEIKVSRTIHGSGQGLQRRNDPESFFQRVLDFQMGSGCTHTA